MFDYIIVGSGIGAAGFISKSELKEKKVCIIANNEDSITKFSTSEGSFEYEYLSRKNLGNIHDWGGVLTLSNHVVEKYGAGFFQKALKNYFNFSNNLSLGNELIGDLLKNELIPRKISDDIHHRKLLISNKKLLERSFEKKLYDNNIVKVSSRVTKFNKVDDHYILDTSDGISMKAKKIVLCCGSIHTRELLVKSGLMKNEDFFATDSQFGRVSRIRFENSLPFGFFHHHVISKSIRFKTGFEVLSPNGDAMFFLQPAIRGVPASDIHLLKEFLRLKKDFSLFNISRFLLNPKAVLQILLMEFSFLNKTTDFDVYCIADYGKRKYSKNFEVNLDGFYKNINGSYESFIDYLKRFSSIQKIDHHVDGTPKFENMESALHMCGTVSYNLDVEYDEDSRIYTLASDKNIIINDNSIVVNKGIANPSIQLF